jgi:RNA-directed DNA polymerase
MNPNEIACQLFSCAAKAGNSEHKRAQFINLPDIVLQQANAIAEERYQPQPFTVFAVTDPKLREIFAPHFTDRLAQQWLVSHIEPWWNKRFIDDSYANRKNKGVQTAINRLQHFMRQPGHRWYCKLDIRAFFASIDRKVLLQLWHNTLPKLPYNIKTRNQLNQVTLAILHQNPTEPAPFRSGHRHLLAKIPPHKSLYHARLGIGMPIGSLTSQFFANVYLNELDQFIKHTLKIKGFLRYVDDFIILGDNPQTLNKQRKAIQHFLLTHLKLELHPNKTVMQRCNQGVDFLGSIVFPSHRLSRQRSVRALRRRLAWFNWLIYPKTARQVPRPPFGTWHRWLANHQVLLASGVPSPALLQRILATINSYYGVFSHANTYRLRKHIYEKELGPLKQFFLPDSAAYHHLKLKICAQ